MPHVAFTEKQIKALNELYQTEPKLAQFSPVYSNLGLGDLIAEQATEIEKTFEKVLEETKRYSFMMG